jgi:hypothetical protein
VTSYLPRRLAGWVLCLAAAAALLVLNPTTAHAVSPTAATQGSAGSGPALALPDLDCKEAPPPTAPSEEGPAKFGAHAAQDPTGTDPFVDSGTTVYREYGWITIWWPTYDLGCGPDIARNPAAVIGSYTAELMALGLLTGTTTFDALIHAVLDFSGLGWVDDALAGIVADLRGEFWLETMTFIGLLIAIYFIVAVMRGDISKVTKAAAWTTFGAILLSVVVNYPAKTSTFFDAAIKSTLSTAYGGTGAIGDPGNSSKQIADGIVGQVYDVIVYDRWCEGMVGGDQAAGQRWCPQLWKSLYLSRSEAAQNADARKDLVKTKMDDFEKIAAEISEQDPAAYQVLQGKNYQERLYAAGSANIIWPVVTMYPIWSLFVLLISLMLLRVMVLLAPVVGPFLLHPAAREAGTGVLKLCGGAFINAVVFCMSSAIYLQVVKAVLASQDANLLVRLTSLFVLSIAFWVATKPWRRLTTMGRGLGTHINKLADDKLSARHIGRQALRASVMIAQLQTLGATATAASRAGDAAQTVAQTTERQNHQWQPAEVTPYEMVDFPPAAPRSPQPPPAPGNSLPQGSAATTTMTDADGRVQHADVYAPGDSGFPTGPAYYSSRPETAQHVDPQFDTDTDGDDGPVYTIYTDTDAGGDQ